ncbi:MAG: AI-2E family transporter [Erysipelotrichia bacterium]|jgi:predicted PurR-regulated permease PerM|nr:AI-2E family transporter [Erysipelotrichia bacterium]
MKFKFEPTLKNTILGFTISGILIVTFTLIALNFNLVISAISSMSALLLPFIVGFTLAFLMSPLQNFIEKRLLKNLSLKQRFKRIISTFFSLVFTLSVLIGLFVVVTPQLISSINTLIDQIPSYIDSTNAFIDQLIAQLNIEAEATLFLQDITAEILQNINQLGREFLPNLLSMSINLLTLIFRLIVGIIIAVYMLLEKERFANQVSKLVLAIVPSDDAKIVFKVSNLAKDKFNQFILGKTVDSIIVGIISFVFMSLLQWPYALLISVIIGITNMIPVFGPFIGAVPGVLILFIVSPSTALWFILFIIVLQQIDGNIIGPKILGDSLGLPTLWIMFAIIVGGGFFGILGMFLGVPVFAVIYVIIKETVALKLKDKGIE